MEKLKGFFSIVLTFGAIVLFFAFVFHDRPTPEQIAAAEAQDRAEAAQAQKESDDKDREIYLHSLIDKEEFETALKDCRALQIKYRLQGSAMICAKWELARQTEEAVTSESE